MELLKITSLVSNTLLALIGIYIVIIIIRVYSLYRSLGFSRTVVTPFLLVGALFAFLGITEVSAVFLDVGLLIHSWIMLLSSVFFLYGLRSYHRILMKAEEKKKLSKMNLYP